MSVSHRYHGLWSTAGNIKHCPLSSQMGELIVYDNGHLELNLFKVPNGTLHTAIHYDVLLGEDSQGWEITLFDIDMKSTLPGATTSYNVRYSIVGAHIPTKAEPIFSRVSVQYPFLKSWIRRPLSDTISQVNEETLEVNTSHNIQKTSLLSNENFNISIVCGVDFNFDHNEFRVFSTENILIETKQETSLESIVEIINELTQFLSFATLTKQHPESIFLCRDTARENLQLLYRNKPSFSPHMMFLLPLDAMKGRMSDIMSLWHKNYHQLAPICKALLQSLDEDEFDAPDFLVVAQALDGYHKRFRNFKDGKDIRKYKEGIDLLLRDFDDIEAIRKLNIDSEILRVSRDKYSHLIPDEDVRHQNAIEGKALLVLTRKCKVLLVCCILNLLGLSKEEINDRLNKSIIKLVVNGIERDEDFLKHGKDSESYFDGLSSRIR